MKSKIILLVLLISNGIYGQVGIGTLSPDNSAGLEVVSTDKGVLLPRVSLTDVNNTTSPINSPVESLLVWNTNASVANGNGVGFYYFNGTKWTFLNKSNTLDEAYDEGGPGAGRTIIADAGAVYIKGTDGLVVTGTFGSGSSIPSIPANTPRMFFNPKKAAFRAGVVNGSQWNDANVGNYSFATGYNAIASGEYSFAANNKTKASGKNASAFGWLTVASGEAAFVTGSKNEASGENSFASGSDTKASGKNSFVTGKAGEAISLNEVVIGSFPTTYTLNAPDGETFNSSDRAFAVGIGSGTSSRKNALEVWKDGRVVINDAYTLPVNDGNADQILTTDGAGNVSWADPDRNIISQSLYAADNNFNYTHSGATATINVSGGETSIFPDIYSSSGDLKIKLIVRLTNMTGSVKFRLRAKDGSSTSFPIKFSTNQTYSTTATGGVLETDWENWSAGTNPYEILLQAQTDNGESIDLSNAYILIKKQ